MPANAGDLFVVWSRGHLRYGHVIGPARCSHRRIVMVPHDPDVSHAPNGYMDEEFLTHMIKMG